MSIPLMEMQFDKAARPVIPTQEAAIVTALTAPGNAIAHVVVLSHGWNNDMDEARTLYRDFLRHLEAAAGAAAPAILGIGVLWPSKKFTDSELIPGGAASADQDPGANAALIKRLDDLKNLFGDDDADTTLEQVKGLVGGLATDPSKQKMFVKLLGGLVDRHTDAEQRTPDEGVARISDQDGAELLKTFGAPIVAKVALAGAGGAASGIGGGIGGGLGANRAMAAPGTGAAGIGDFFSGIKAGALRFTNYTTYLTMKDRAGIIGRDAVNPFLGRVQAAAAPTVKFHIVGHSFGGRLATATVDGPNKLRVQTLLLLQAAYSHNGLATNFDGKGANGFFRKVLVDRKVAGPILITHSKHDSAVGRSYPLASRLNGANAAGLGDKNDVYGGMGANGAQHVDNDRAEIELLAVGGAYDFTGGKAIFNLNADKIIADHNDVAKAETGYLLAKAMGL